MKKIKGLFRRKENGKESETWWMRFSVNGNQMKISTGTSDMRLAERILYKVKTQIAEGKWLDVNTAKQHDFDELMEKYLNDHSKINKAASTHTKDLGMKEHLKRSFEDTTLDQIDSGAVLSYKNKRLGEGAAQNTVKNELGMLRNALNMAQHVWKWTRGNPFAGLKLELKANFIDRWLTTEEEQELLNASVGKLFGQLSDIIILDLHTGLSQEEILNLKWTQIDFPRKALTTTRKKTKKKDKPTRTIPLNSTALEILERRNKVRAISGYAFFNTAGNRIDAGKLKRDFIKARNDAKLEDVRFHDLRHTFATRLVQRGIDLYRVAKLLGHSSIEVTERYAHHCPESLRSSVEILDDHKTLVLEKKDAKKRVRKAGNA